MLGRAGNEYFVGDFLVQPVQHSRFRNDDDLARWGIFAERDHPFC